MLAVLLLSTEEVLDIFAAAHCQRGDPRLESSLGDHSWAAVIGRL